jgi:hypothetical protein
MLAGLIVTLVGLSVAIIQTLDVPRYWTTLGVPRSWTTLGVGLALLVGGALRAVAGGRRAGSGGRHAPDAGAS